MSEKVFTFGEAMLRLTAPNHRRLEQAQEFKAFVGGSEMNVAICNERLGLDTSFITRLVDNPLGKMVANKCREHGVETSNIIWSEEGRVGKYYLEHGANPRPSSVIYDRQNSAISKIKPGMIDWDAVFDQSGLFHTSGITPALSDSAFAVTKEAMLSAKESDLTVSVDLNYRSKLWSQEEAQRAMTELMEDTDLLITTEEDIERVFGISGEDYAEVAQELSKKFDFEAVAITLRDNISMWRNDWTAIAYADGQIYDDMTYELELVDRVGGGDAFTGGFLYGYLTGGVKKGVKFGNASSAIKQTNPGDLTWATAEEVENLVKDGGRIRIDR